MLDKFFGRSRKKVATTIEPAISFGRYSDNNKPLSKVNRWTDADNLFKEKKYNESLDAFFDYLADDQANNVVHERNGAEGRFSLYQGSKIVRGSYNAEHLHAEVTLAKMPQSSVPVMRRLLEMNFNLYYSRYALDDERLCMRFDSDIETANPSKLYYGLKELSTRGDKQDDLLVLDFSALETLDTEHILAVPDAEKEVKYTYLQKWINEVVNYSRSLDPDKFSGGIAYMLLALSYRIDYMILPEGKLLHELEKIVEIYFKKDDKPVTEKNRDMLAAFDKLLGMSKEDIFNSLYRSKHTFAIVTPQTYKTISEAIYNANQNVNWYRDNNYPKIGAQISEYGIAYCQYSYSLPRPVSEFFHLFMMVNYPDYFTALEFRVNYYLPGNTGIDGEKVIERMNEIVESWKSKYPNLRFKPESLKFDNLLNFNLSFTTEIELFNLETK